MKTIRYDKKETTAWKYLVLISEEVFRNSMVNSYFEVINVKHIYFVDKFHELFFTTEEKWLWKMDFEQHHILML